MYCCTRSVRLSTVDRIDESAHSDSTEDEVIDIEIEAITSMTRKKKQKHSSSPVLTCGRWA